jgi:hypothetical protein
MTSQANLASILRQQQLSIQATIAANSKCDSSYDNEYRRFCQWVSAQPELGCIGPPYLSRLNIDHYFSRFITTRVGCVGNLRRVVNALQWYASHREHVGSLPAFICTSPVVEESLKAQRLFNTASGGSGNPGSDPHYGLKDILPENDKVLIMSHIYRNRNDWGPASVNFTWGTNGAVRGASNRKITYCDLNLSYGFGPEETGPLARGLLLILRKGTLHKDRHETDKQVCCWRHKNYKLCSVFSTAAYVLWNLRRHPDVNFYHEARRTERASWWDIPLIDWDQYNGK